MILERIIEYVCTEKEILRYCLSIVNNRGKTPLEFAVRHQNYPLVKAICKVVGVNAIVNVQRCSVLQVAVRYGWRELVSELLLYPELDLHYRNLDTKTALDIAKEWSPDCMDMLLRADKENADRIKRKEHSRAIVYNKDVTSINFTSPSTYLSGCSEARKECSAWNGNAVSR